MRPQRAVSKPPVILNEAQGALLGQGVGPTLLGKTCGVSKMAASKWLRGLAVPDDVHAAAIEQAFGVPARGWRRAAPKAPGVTVAPSGVTPSKQALTPRLPRPARPATPPARQALPAPTVRQLPADWARRPGESRPEMFARRSAWHGAELMAEQEGRPAPVLTSDVDLVALERWRAEVKRRLTAGTA